MFTYALVADLYRKISNDYLLAKIDFPAVGRLKNFNSNHLRSIQIACWLLSHDTFNQVELDRVSTFLTDDLSLICNYVQHQKWTEEDDRGEELVRLALKRLEVLPHGESREEAEDRFDAISTIKRHGVLEKSNEAYERMMAIRRKMAEAKAREASNPYSRE